MPGQQYTSMPLAPPLTNQQQLTRPIATQTQPLVPPPATQQQLGMFVTDKTGNRPRPQMISPPTTQQQLVRPPAVQPRPVSPGDMRTEMLRQGGVRPPAIQPRPVSPGDMRTEMLLQGGIQPPAVAPRPQQIQPPINQQVPPQQAAIAANPFPQPPFRTMARKPLTRPPAVMPQQIQPPMSQQVPQNLLTKPPGVALAGPYSGIRPPIAQPQYDVGQGTQQQQLQGGVQPRPQQMTQQDMRSEADRMAWLPGAGPGDYKSRYLRAMRLLQQQQQGGVQPRPQPQQQQLTRPPVIRPRPAPPARITPRMAARMRRPVARDVRPNVAMAYDPRNSQFDPQQQIT